MIVNTNGKRIRDEPKISGTLCVCGSNQSVSEHLIGIEIRGSTSARDFLKKSYGVETRDKEGSDLDTSILGFPQGSDWVFYGPEMDKSMGIKNFLTMELYRSGGKYSSRVQYFELFLIDDKTELSMDHYNGLYILMEKIKRGDERVAIKRLKDDDISGDQIFNSSESGLAFIVTYPAKANVVKRSLDYLSAYVGEVELALRSRNRSIWRNYINEDSFIDIFLITELTKNPDGYRGSFYFHKDPGGILSAGPPWDFNEAYGVCCGYPIEGYFNEGVSRGRSGGSAISPNGWRYNICVDRGRCIVDPMDGVSWWFRTLLEDNTFRSKLRRRWQLLRRGPWSISTIQSYFSRIRTAISEPVRRNANRWNRELAIKNESASFDEWNDEISRMESWTISRLEWIDARLATLGVHVHVIKVETTNGPIEFECWDSSGQQALGSHKDGYYQGAQFAILFFDVQSRLSYKNCPLWFRDLTRIEAEVSVVLVGNKVDLSNRQVKPKQVTFHKKVEIPYIEMSAKSNYNVDQPFLIFARLLFNDSTVELKDGVELTAPEIEIDLIEQQQRRQEEDDKRDKIIVDESNDDSDS
eukprot:g5768.t1